MASVLFLTIVILCFVTGRVSPISGGEDYCEQNRKELDSCLDQLPPLSQGIPSSEQHVNASCVAFQKRMLCVDNYADKCLNAQSRDVLNAEVAGARHTFSYLCSDPLFLREYLEHASCLKAVSNDWDVCTHNYMIHVSQGFNNITHTQSRVVEICCASYKFLNCVYAAGTRKCSKEGALFLRRMAVTLSNVKVYYNTLCRGTKDGTSAPEVCDGSAQALPSFTSYLIILMAGAGFLQGRV